MLASGSSYRRALLEQLGVAFEVDVPDVDESAYKSNNRAPAAVALDLARAKAHAIQSRRPDAVVIGSDQIIHLDGQIFDKPGSVERAVAQLAALSGRTHEVLTALVVATQHKSYELVATARLTMRPLGHDALRAYVERDRPLDCAGSYKLESAGAALFDHVDADDPTAIVGLPLAELARILVALGFEVAQPQDSQRLQTGKQAPHSSSEVFP